MIITELIGFQRFYWRYLRIYGNGLFRSDPEKSVSALLSPVLDASYLRAFGTSGSARHGEIYRHNMESTVQFIVVIKDGASDIIGTSFWLS